VEVLGRPFCGRIDKREGPGILDHGCCSANDSLVCFLLISSSLSLPACCSRGHTRPRSRPVGDETIVRKYDSTEVHLTSAAVVVWTSREGFVSWTLA